MAALLGMVYARLPSPADRVRFAAVCTSWRIFASTYPSRPVLPWMMLNPRSGDDTKSVYCPDDGIVLERILIRSEAAAGYYIGGYDGGWVASSDAPPRIVNLFSGKEVAFSPAQSRTIRAQQSTGERLFLRKVIFSEAPTSSGCILAAITDKLSVAICRVGYLEGGWKIREFHGDERIMDITFYNGELYGLERYSNLIVKLNIGMNKDGGAMITSIQKLYMQRKYHWRGPDEYPRYIVELHGKLVMVEGTPWRWWRNITKPFFTVHELISYKTGAALTYQWVELRCLGDYALFVGPTYSKSVSVPMDGCGGVKRNHIYYSYHLCLRQDDQVPDGAIKFLSSSDDEGERVYYSKEDGTGNNVEAIMSVRYFVRSGVHPPMWLLPPDI
ncbi:unnamed protein product [Alopecurus aequalis]